MARRILVPLIAALVAAAAVVGGQAIAADKGTKTQKLQGTAHAHAVGEGSKIAGTTKDKYLGAGAVVFDDAELGAARKIHFTLFASKAPSRASRPRTPTINPDGTTLSISNCTIKFTGGAGAYNHASGTGTCDGGADANQNFTVHYKGSVKVPK
jgi:hypothetical protein